MSLTPLTVIPVIISSSEREDRLGELKAERGRYAAVMTRYGGYRACADQVCAACAFREKPEESCALMWAVQTMSDSCLLLLNNTHD